MHPAEAPLKRAIISAITSAIVPRFDPTPIIMTRSSARGEADQDSDQDLLVALRHGG